jgi:aminoglycoside 2''-phosphotransferase
VDSRSARKLIEECFPQLQIRHSRQILTGWENLVLEVNREYVFRFPKYRDTEKRLRNEIAFLPTLRRHLSTQVPDYEFIEGRKEVVALVWWVPQDQRRHSAEPTLQKEWTRPLAAQIASFLKELHRIRFRDVRFRNILRYSPEEWYGSIRLQYRKVRRIVYPLLDTRLRKRSEAFWQKLLSEFRDSSFEPTLIHGDLGTENLLFDPASVRLTGILDWGYMQVSDPALEFAHLFMHKAELGEEVLKQYRMRESSFKKRVQWYIDSEPFYDIMWGVSHDWDKPKRMGLRQLARTLDA